MLIEKSYIVKSLKAYIIAKFFISHEIMDFEHQFL